MIELDVTATVQPEIELLATVPEVVIDLEMAGPPGPQGEQGEKGDTGDLGTDKTFSYTFTNQSSLTIEHGLDKYPSVTVIDSAGDQVFGEVEYLDTNAVTVSFSGSFSGLVLFN